MFFKPRGAILIGYKETNRNERKIKQLLVLIGIATAGAQLYVIYNIKKHQMENIMKCIL